MRLKTYTAKTMNEVMSRVREELGPDAIIINIDQGKRVGGVRVTAAFEGEIRPRREPATPRPVPSPALTEDEPKVSAGRKSNSGPSRKSRSRPFDMAELTAVMSHQGIPYDMAMRLQTAASAIDANSLPEALAAALETCFGFHPIGIRANKPFILIGPPGAGKTVSTAKLAAEAVLNGQTVRLISTDTVKSTGIEQLEGFARLIAMGIETAASPGELGALLKPGYGGKERADLTLIDTQGFNPFQVDELEEAARFIKASGAEPVLVLPAGLDPMEAADIAEIFASMGARRLISTRLDAARRFAGILTAAQAGNLAIAAFGRSPYVAQNLEAANPLMLARIIAALPKSRYQTQKKERASR